MDLCHVLSNTRITIVGPGRLGTALGAAMRAAGLDVAGPLGRGADGSGSDVVLLCVPDAEIAAAARVIRGEPLVGHTSGATSLAALAPHEAFSLHPLLSVAKEGTQFRGAGCAVAGSTERAVQVATSLAEALGMQPFAVADADRPLYHAAAAMASNYLVALEAAAERLAGLAGVGRKHLAPLVRSAVDQWADVGALDALTGPVARGDEETVARQRSAVAARAADMLPLWDTLTDATRTLARSRTAASR
ncbi:MAG TPA: Rossmann-like and DUF2520 domain-containing protein [Gemmatimonadaceae bacterium]|jgi:predicted short-subunit dehydrogenase-like oxidoreductase (DUF2520 family)